MATLAHAVAADLIAFLYVISSHVIVQNTSVSAVAGNINMLCCREKRENMSVERRGDDD